MARLDLNLSPAVATKAVEWCRERVDHGEHHRKVVLSEDTARLKEELRKIEPFSRDFPSIVAVVAYVIKHLEEEEEAAAASKGTMGGDVGSDLSSVGGVEVDGRDRGIKWLDTSDGWRFGSETTNSAKETRGREWSTALALSPTVGQSNTDAQLVLRPCQRNRSHHEVVAEQQRRQAAGRKRRRCWSHELHRRFVDVLQKLGGPQAATPKHIRELMKVNGLTNNEVKSHLQKYRLRIKKKSTAHVWEN